MLIALIKICLMLLTQHGKSGAKSQQNIRNFMVLGEWSPFEITIKWCLYVLNLMMT